MFSQPPAPLLAAFHMVVLVVHLSEGVCSFVRWAWLRNEAAPSSEGAAGASRLEVSNSLDEVGVELVCQGLGL